MARDTGLGQVLQLLVVLVAFVGIPILRKLAQRAQERARGSAPPGPRTRSSAQEEARRLEDLSRGRDVFETLRRGSRAPDAGPVAAPSEPELPPAIPWLEPADPVAQALPREPEPWSALPEGEFAGSLAGMESAGPVDEEADARAETDRERALAIAWEQEGRIVEESTDAGGARLGLELAVAAEFGSEVEAASPEPARVASLRRFDLRSAVLAAEVLGPPLALRDGPVGPASAPGLRGA